MSAEDSTEQIKPRSIDFAKFTGPYPVLALFLVVVEASLATWLMRASEPGERITAGVLMAGLLGSVLLVLRSSLSVVGSKNPSAPIGDNLTPANNEATKSEIEKPQPEVIAGPDKSFTIERPPSDWIVRELTMSECVSGVFGVSNKSPSSPDTGLPLGLNSSSAERNILYIEAPEATTITPKPGETLVDERKIFTALETFCRVRLMIFPLNRHQPPWFQERSFEHNFYSSLGDFLKMGCALRNVKSGKMEKSDRRFMQADLNQELRHISVEGKTVPQFDIYVTVFGIEGEIRDHLLFLNYYRLQGVTTAAQDTDVAILRQLVNSFRPLKIVSSEEAKQALLNEANASYDKFIKDQGPKILGWEGQILALRLNEINIDDLDGLARAVKMLRPFVEAAKLLPNFDDGGLHSAIEMANAGNPAHLKHFIKRLSEIGSNNEGSPSAPPNLPS